MRVRAIVTGGDGAFKSPLGLGVAFLIHVDLRQLHQQLRIGSILQGGLDRRARELRFARGEPELGQQMPPLSRRWHGAVFDPTTQQ